PRGAGIPRVGDDEGSRPPVQLLERSCFFRLCAHRRSPWRRGPSLILSAQHRSPKGNNQAGAPDMAYDFIISERLDGVGFITLNRPDKLNALSFDLVRELDEALTGFEADDAIKAVVITGA